jgi:bromodomain-containing factor 1
VLYRTSQRDERPSEATSIPAKLPVSPLPLDSHNENSTAVNGTSVASPDPIGTASDSHPTDTTSVPADSSIQLPESLPTTVADGQPDMDEVDSILPNSIDAAIDAAVEDSTVTSTVPPVVEAPESDLRDAVDERDTASEVKPEQADSSLDADLSTQTNSLDIKQDSSADQDNILSPSEISAPSQAEAGQPAAQDTEMTEAPQVPFPTKVSREREDDEEADRAAKRTKTEAEGDALPVTETTVNGASEPVQNGDATIAVEQSQEPSLTPYMIKEIIKHVKNAVRTADGKNFRLPVTDLWPQLAESYAAKISKPMDLATLEKNLRNNVYPTLKEVREDIQLLHGNAVTFNGPDHDVTKSAERLSSSLTGKISNIPPEPVPVPKKVPEKKSKASTPVVDTTAKSAPTRRQSRGANTSAIDTTPAQTFALDPQSNTPLIRRDSTKAESGRPKRDIIPPKNKDLPYSVRPKSKKFAVELRWSHEALNELKKPKYAAFNFPFLTPVDPVALGIPTYFSVIKHPMDLSTVESKLDNGLYTTSKDFEKDVGLIVSNCFKFNPPGNPVHDLGKSFENLWKEQLGKKARWISDHTPAAVSASPTPESDAEESEEEAEAPPANAGGSAIFKRLVEEQSKLIEIMSSPNVNEQELKLQQDMVNFLQRQVEAEKVAAPAAKKAKKAKAPKTTAAPSKKKNVPASKSSTSKKAGGGRKERYLGTLEKEVISMGIGSLPENVSDTVLTWIQNDRPDLGVSSHSCAMTQWISN